MYKDPVRRKVRRRIRVPLSRLVDIGPPNFVRSSATAGGGAAGSQLYTNLTFVPKPGPVLIVAGPGGDHPDLDTASDKLQHPDPELSPFRVKIRIIHPEYCMNP